MQPPNDPPVTRQRWVSFDEARMILRMSEGTLRREIKAGRVPAEKRRRNPDSATDLRDVYEVLVTDPPAPASQSESAQPPTGATDTPALSERLLETVLTQAETIAELRERVGRAEAAAGYADRERRRADDLAETLIALRASLSATQAERDRLKGELAAERERPWWRKALGLPPA